MANTVVNVVIFIAISALTLLLFLQVFPTFLDIVKTAVFYSPDVVTRDIAGLVTITGAAPYKITILYGSDQAHYNIEIKDRLVSVEQIDDQGKIIGKSPKSKTAIDPEIQLENVNRLLIENILGNYNVRQQQ